MRHRAVRRASEDDAARLRPGRRAHGDTNAAACVSGFTLLRAVGIIHRGPRCLSVRVLRMRTTLLSVAVVAVALAAQACMSSGKYKELGVDEVAQLQSATPVTFVDANTVDFRKENGIIPGAIIL